MALHGQDDLQKTVEYFIDVMWKDRLPQVPLPRPTVQVIPGKDGIESIFIRHGSATSKVDVPPDLPLMRPSDAVDTLTQLVEDALMKLAGAYPMLHLLSDSFTWIYNEHPPTRQLNGRHAWGTPSMRIVTKPLTPEEAHVVCDVLLERLPHLIEPPIMGPKKPIFAGSEIPKSAEEARAQALEILQSEPLFVDDDQ